MIVDEDRLSDNIVRLMSNGVSLKHKDGELQITGNRSGIENLDQEDLRLLNDRKEDIIQLLFLDSQKQTDQVRCSEIFEGRMLGKHLVKFWQGVDSGKFDEFFTNLTHSISRLPKAITPPQFLKGARLVIDRHPALRMTLSPAGDELYKIGLVDFRETDVRVEYVSEAASYDDMKARALQLISEKLDSKRGMVRLFLVQQEGCSLIGLVINHFVSDLKSVAAVTWELIAACYGQKIEHSDHSIQAEHDFIAEISDLYDYSSDPRFALTRAFWRDITSRGVYRDWERTGTPTSSKATNIKFLIDASALGTFTQFTKTHGLTPLGLLVALHASAQRRVFGYSTTISLLTTRNRIPGSTSVGKMDDVKPMNIQSEDVVPCAREVGQYRRMTQRFRFLPYDVFPELFYGGKAPLTPFLNLIVADNVGKRDFFSKGSFPSTGRTEATTFDAGADQRFDFEDYSLQVTIKETGIYGMLSFPHKNLSEKDGEALVNALIDAFENLAAERPTPL